MSNTLKTPQISDNTKVLSFDLESNGLHGEVFAVGAVVMDSSGKVLEEFTGRCKIEGKIDEWVENNVIPVITDMEETHSSYKHLRENFWAWFIKAKVQADYVLVNNGYPVEYRFLAKCQDDDIEERYWGHPFPVLDLTSFLIGKGYTEDSDKTVQDIKNKVMGKYKTTIEGSPHHPLYDAKITCMALFAA